MKTRTEKILYSPQNPWRIIDGPSLNIQLTGGAQLTNFVASFINTDWANTHLRVVTWIMIQYPVRKVLRIILTPCV